MRWIVASLVVVNIIVFIYFTFVVRGDISRSSTDTVDDIQLRPYNASRTLWLLSESELIPKVEDIRLNPLVPQNNSALSSSVDGPVLCTLIGAFRRQLQAEYFMERLQSLGLQAEVKNLVVDTDPNYWLHLPPETSKREALRRLSELQGRGIDSYVIPTGNLKNGISLGMFSNQDRAELLQNEVKAQGYDAQIVNVPREQKENWVFLPQGEAGKLSQERWSELLSSEEYLQKRQNLCSDLASY